ncbi:MAG TPA: 6-phosphogluconolactonase [Verrucomicrobiae bacterium]
MKTKLQLQYLPTPEELAKAAATKLVGLLKRRSDLRQPFGIALSGGRIALPFYDCIVKLVQESPTSFDDVHFFWADERCVPGNSPESNFSIAHKHLFEPLRIPAENIHRILADRDISYAVQEAEAELCRVMPLNPAAQPILDVVILGMGEDGHVASLFPEESAEALNDDRVYRHVVATKPPPNRITIGYQPILAAREVWVLASGIGKISAFHGLLAGDERLPIARVGVNRKQTLVFQDIEKTGI